MPRNLLVAALVWGLAAAPAFAQGQPAATPDPVRTLEQNQRAYVAPRAAAQQATPAKERPVAATLPTVSGRRVELADRDR
ncbi:hypothetical protein E2C06_12810 [Dankookia rubra]|uniref:Uncharacterized protein n=1 Tax=Dankookia rubra TaxID=1442381 RepID=A0A4R5QHN6_9PROT|nr:hypothetical protein [Dankookia rubra]TDH62259.1 hypothetical protein E2C06_12810 [Dankookia rubra]